MTISFSVVIPTYNRRDSVVKAVRSVLAQDYRAAEIIVIDDGSDTEIVNGLRKELNQFSDDRIQFIPLSVHTNGAVARNAGIDAAKGQFICFLDSDDTWHQDKLSIVANIIGDRVGESLLIHHQYVNVDHGICKAALPRIGKKPEQTVAEYSFITNNVGGIQSSTITVSANVAKDVKFNANLIGHQDWDFALKCESFGATFVFINKALTSRYRDGIDSVAARLSWQYSYSFWHQYRRFFSKKSTTYYFVRVIAKKIIAADKSTLVFSQWLFWVALFREPAFVTKTLFRQFTQRRNLLKRIKALGVQLSGPKPQQLVLWGANSYSVEILKHFKESSVNCVVDNAIPEDSEFTFMGKPLIHPSRLTPMESSEIDAVITATDKHHVAMIDLLKVYSPQLAKKVIRF